MASWKKNYLNVPSISITDCEVPVRNSMYPTPVRAFDMGLPKSKYPMPIRACDMNLPGTTNKKTASDTGVRKYPMPVRTCDMDLPGTTKTASDTGFRKYPMPVRACDMNLPDPTNKKTATPKPFKFQPMRWREMDLPDNQQTSTTKTPISKSTNLDNGPKPRRIVRKQLWSDKINKNRLSIKMKPEKRITMVGKTNIPKSVTKLDNVRQLVNLKKYEQKTEKDVVENRTMFEELIIKIDKLQETLDQKFDDLTKKIEKLLELKCNCHPKSDKISTPQVQKKTKFEILEQRLERGSPISDALSLSDSDSPIVKQEMNSLISDKSDIKKSFSTSNLAEKPKKSVHFTSVYDIRSRYEEIRSEASFLCTPKNTTKVKNLMTPSVKNNNKKLISRTIQKQLILLDDN